MSFKAVSLRGQKFLQDYAADRLYKRALRYATIGSIGLASKLALKFLNVNTTRLDILNEAIDTARLESRGLLTIMNHTSILDDPWIWGVLPYSLMKADNMRWTLGADNICFRTKTRAAFFRSGKVLSTKRFGEGPFQGSVDAAIELLSPRNDDIYYIEQPRKLKSIDTRSVPPQWVHVFPESQVHQAVEPYESTLRYFHWGISRLVLEARKPPIVLPIFINGLQHILPEDYSKRKSLKDIYCSDLSVSFAKPVDDDVIAGYRQKWVELVQSDSNAHPLQGEMTEFLRTGAEAQKLRSDLARMLREEMDVYRLSLGLPAAPRGAETPQYWSQEQKKREIKVMNNDHKKNPPLH